MISERMMHVAVTATGAALIARDAAAVLYWRPRHALPQVTTAIFLRAAHRLAGELPLAEAYLNLCREPCGAALALAAALLRGRPCILAPDRSPAGIAALRQRYPGAHPIIGGDDLPAGMPASIADAGPEDAAGPVPEMPRPRPDQLAVIGITSGSTGQPSAHGKSWGALEQRSRAAAGRFGLRGATRPVVGSVSATHMYGFETLVLLPWHADVTTWCGQAFLPGDAAAALHDARAAAGGAAPLFITMPLHLSAMLETFTAVPPLHAVISATAPLPAELAARAEAAWQAPVLEIFGATEVGSIASRRTVREEAWTPYPGVVLEWRDGVAEVVAPGVPRRPMADLLEELPDGRFRLVARGSDIIKRGGRRASLAGLNSILARLPGVQDSAFLVPDPAAGRAGIERPIAFVVAPGRSAPELLAELRGRLDPAFMPRRLIVLERLPRNEMGKLPREALLAALRAAG